MSTPYLPPGASPRPGDEPPGADPAGSAPGVPPAGYRPPAQSPAGVAHEHEARLQDAGSAESAGYRPPASAPAGVPPTSGAVASSPGSSGSVPPVTPAPATPPASAPAHPEASPAAPHRARRRLLMLAGVAVLLVALVLGGAALMGLFAPKLSRLPGRVDAYVKEAPPQKATASEYDAATYRAAAGDLYTAVIKKQGSDPSAAFAKASQATRFQLDNVYCTGVSKGGKGGNCSVLLDTGAVLTVSGSTRHTAADIATFTVGVRNGIR